MKKVSSHFISGPFVFHLSHLVSALQPTLKGRMNRLRQTLLRRSNLTGVVYHVAVLGKLLIGELEGQGCNLGFLLLDSS